MAPALASAQPPDKTATSRLEKLPRPPWDVAIQARGLAPKRVERVDGTKPLRVRLEPGAVLTGIVRDGSTREPVPEPTSLVCALAREPGRA
jgi:hypothetical protein